MANDWIQVRAGLKDNAKVHRIASHLSESLLFRLRLLKLLGLTFDIGMTRGQTSETFAITADMSRDIADMMRDMSRELTVPIIINALVSVWSKVNEQGRQDGDDRVIPGGDAKVVDYWCGIDGFAEAMMLADVGWLVAETTDTGRRQLRFPEWFLYNTPVEARAKGDGREASRKARVRKKLLGMNWRKLFYGREPIMVPPEAGLEATLESLYAQGWVRKVNADGVLVMAEPSPAETPSPSTRRDMSATSRDSAKRHPKGEIESKEHSQSPPTPPKTSELVVDEDKEALAKEMPPCIIPPELNVPEFRVRVQLYRRIRERQKKPMTAHGWSVFFEQCTLWGLAKSLKAWDYTIAGEYGNLILPREENRNGSQRPTTPAEPAGRPHAEPGKYDGVSIDASAYFAARRAAQSAKNPGEALAGVGAAGSGEDSSGSSGFAD